MSTIHVQKKVSESISYIRSKYKNSPQTAIVLGTGMYSLVDILEDSICLPYQEIPHFPVSTVASHKGCLYFGKIKDKDIVLVAGRFHYYEGYNMEEVTYYIHVLKALGVKLSIMTSASGGLNPHYKEGELVVITDHINLFPSNPLRGANDDDLGPRFPDLMKAYPKLLVDKALTTSDKLGIKLKTGVYLGWQGPSLETPAEYRMAHLLGADLVGMSTIPEVIVNKYRDIHTLAFTIVSNVCYPLDSLSETTVEEVIKVVNLNAKKLQKIILSLLSSI